MCPSTTTLLPRPDQADIQETRSDADPCLDLDPDSIERTWWTCPKTAEWRRITTLDLIYRYALSIIDKANLISVEVDCKGTLITPEGNDMDNRDCIKQASAKSIAAINRGQGGEYCLLRFEDGNCENLENSESVKLEEGGGDHCTSLADGLHGSYSWIKTSGIHVSLRTVHLLTLEARADRIVSCRAPCLSSGP